MRSVFCNISRTAQSRRTLLSNLGLFLNSKSLARPFMQHLYEQIVDAGRRVRPGHPLGANLSIFAACRGLYEPFNRHRKLVGFDSFAGFPSVSEKDGKSDLMKAGNVTVTDNYIDYLDRVMTYQEGDNPLSHIKKYELVKGDASKTVAKYLEDNPETIVSLAYFDFDIYEPTKDVLELIRPRLVKRRAGRRVERPDSPGETLALMETFGLNNIKLRRHRHTSRVSYFVVE